MMIRFNLYHPSTALILIFVVLAPARAETLNCTPITALPATINTQGIYCLTGNLATAASTGNAIEITANNVTLDLNGWKVGGQAAGSGTNAIGIFSDATNVAIKNGIVRGFWGGINLFGRGAVVEDMLIDQNTGTGIWVTGQGAIVRRNQVVDTGGSTVAPNVNGIVASGPGSLIEDNLLSGLQAATDSGFETGILLSGTNDSLVRRNFVTDAVKPAGGSRGIAAQFVTNINILGNTVSNMTTCIFYQNSTGIFANNTVTGCDTSFDGGTAGQQGNNF